MQSESPSVPQIWLLLSNAATAILAIAGTLTALWFKRKREPIEIAKISAETRQIHISTEVASINVSRDLIRELQSVTEKAEQRREEWLLKEDQMRTQTLFWRNKAEELDGELIDSREANALLQAKLKNALDDAEAAHIFVDELNNAAKMKGVRLRDFTPAQLKWAKDNIKDDPDTPKGNGK